MKKSFFIPTGNAQKGIWISNFNNKLTPALATKLGVSTEEKTELDADTKAFMFGQVLSEGAKSFEHQCVTYLQTIKNPPNGNDPIDVPVYAVVAVAPTAVASGIFTRVGKLVKKIKLSSNYTNDIGQLLGIISSVAEAKSASDEVMPILTGKMVAGNVQIKYVKGDNDGIRLESKRGTETNFTLVDKINKPVYSDKRPNLIVGQAEKREYRAWFFIGDEVIGQVSAVITVLVS